jgi:hypothetical protein
VATVSNSAIVGTPQVLRLPKADTAEWYYFSLRTATAYDTSLASTYVGTVSVHRSSGTLPARTYLLQSLAAGQTFTDATNGITVTNQGGTTDQATVAITLSAPTCARSAPTVALSPASQSASPGGTISYGLTVTNNNTSACGSSTFNLSKVLPSGFSGSLAATSVTLAAGASGSTTLSVTSPGTATGGTYNVDATAADAASASSSATQHASYVVYADTTPPAISLTSPAAGATISGTKSVTLAASASDASGIQSVEFYVDGVLLARDTSAPYSASWSLRRVAKGSHTLRARAVDTAGNSAEQSIVVTVN